MLRMQWAWECETKTVLAAASKKLELHQRRLDHYQAALAETERKVRTEGIVWEQPDANISPMTTRTVNYNEGLQIDPDLRREMGRYKTKVAEHDGQVELYAAWVVALSRPEAPATLHLQFDDLQFFGLDHAL